MRTFADVPARRERVPILVGLAGASGSGKTYSALRLATGMQQATGKDIYFIDTESRRALHYAEAFRFRHIAMDAPFSPLDYLAAIEHCVKKGAGIVVIDSLSHEHEGPGGVLEMHDRELDRMCGDDQGKRNRMTFPAWAKPKAERRRLINSILQMGVNLISCFRAKEKMKMVAGKAPVELGWMPIAGEEYVYEQTMQVLLYPGCGGVPTWNPQMPGERAMTKLPEQFRRIFAQSQPLSEEIGKRLAEWAAGGSTAEPEPAAETPGGASISEDSPPPGAPSSPLASGPGPDPIESGPMEIMEVRPVGKAGNAWLIVAERDDFGTRDKALADQAIELIGQGVTIRHVPGSKPGSRVAVSLKA